MRATRRKRLCTKKQAGIVFYTPTTQVTEFKQRRFTIESGLSEPTLSQVLPPSLLDAAADGIIVGDDRARILVFNRPCERLFGYAAAEMVGRNLDAIIRRDAGDEGHLDFGGECIRRLVGGGRQVVGRHRDGTEFPVEMSIGETLTPDGRRFIAIVRDLRPRHAAEERRNRMQGDIMRMIRMLAMDEMGSALAHEVNQPLTALMLYLQAVTRAAENPTGGSTLAPKLSAILDKAVAEAERVGHVIQRMRDFVDRPDPERRLLDLNPLVTDAVDFALVGTGMSTRVIRRLANDLPAVLVDPLQIQQVVINLMRNALELNLAPDARLISVATRRAADEVVLVIEDDGPGIPPQKLPELFKPFSASIVEGLGLAISRTIAQSHGGNLEVDPGGRGSGARYSLRLPVSRSAAKEEDDPAGTALAEGRDV